MDVIHFTKGATDPLTAFAAKGGAFVPLADGDGELHLGCLHLDPGAEIRAPSLSHAAALLIVHGRIIVSTVEPFIRIDFSGGMGCVFESNEAYSLRSETGAIVLVVESSWLAAHRRGISTPQRIAGQTWPGD